MIERWVTPDGSSTAITVGDADLSKCKPTLDTFAASSPTGAGFCSQIAWADDNPDYDVNARPAPQLKKVLQEVGPAC